MGKGTVACPNCARLTAYLTRRLAEIHDLLRIDHKLDIDPYDDVARLREVEAALRVLRRRGAAGTVAARPGRE